MSGEKEYHIQLSTADIQQAEYAIVPGDPGRVAEIALALDLNAKELMHHREFHSFLCKPYLP